MIALVPSRSQQVDEFAVLDNQVKAFAPTAKRHAALASEIRGWYQDHPADSPTLAEGKDYDILVAERTEERTLGLKAKAKIFAVIGKAAALSFFSLTLKAATAAVGEVMVEELATKERTGYRKLVPIAKVSAQKAA